LPVDRMSTCAKKRRSFETLKTQIKDKCGRVIDVRVYEAGDFGNLKAMYDAFEPKGLEAGLPPEDSQTRLKWLRNVTASLFNILALYEGRVIGHCALDLSCRPSCPEYLIFIEKQFRNCGIGTKLSAIMRGVALEAGCEKIYLTVRTANTRAIKVFKRVGFEFRGNIEIERDMELNLKGFKRKSEKI
jgi:RimJ/RimL family protein N-acetyltransferase